MRSLRLTALVLGLALTGDGRAVAQGPIPVRVVEAADGSAHLERGGQAYFVKGGGGEGSMALLAACGGNSVRTWGADRLGATLDEAQEHGLTVCAGIWLGHERHGFKYSDRAQVERQFEQARQVILRHKDHPALLTWGIGNEMEGDGRNPAVWSAVNDIAAMARKLDPNHPTMTVIADLGEGGIKVKELNRLCPEVQIVGINSYGPAATVPERYRKAGGVKPYLLTEFGPAGQWETPKTPWGAAPEKTSTEKAEVYRRVYTSAVLDQPRCLGSYAFLWGHKQEATATWFGLLLPDGSRTGAVDALTELWTVRPPANRCPSVRPLTLAGPPRGKPGVKLRATLDASDPDGDPLTVQWELRREGTYGAGGDAEAAPPSFPDAITRSDLRGAELTLPKQPGAYRLFAYVRDDHGGAATANVPLLVDAP